MRRGGRRGGLLMAGVVKAGTALLSSITAVLLMKAAGEKENLEDICGGNEVYCAVIWAGNEAGLLRASAGKSATAATC